MNFKGFFFFFLSFSFCVQKVTGVRKKFIKNRNLVSSFDIENTCFQEFFLNELSKQNQILKITKNAIFLQDIFCPVFSPIYIKTILRFLTLLKARLTQEKSLFLFRQFWRKSQLFTGLKFPLKNQNKKFLCILE